MDAHEKAKELLHKYVLLLGSKIGFEHDLAKQCAIICATEMIESYSKYTFRYEQEIFDSEVAYWQDVLTELNKL